MEELASMYIRIIVPCLGGCSLSRETSGQGQATWIRMHDNGCNFPVYLLRSAWFHVSMF